MVAQVPAGRRHRARSVPTSYWSALDDLAEQSPRKGVVESVFYQRCHCLAGDRRRNAPCSATPSVCDLKKPDLDDPGRSGSRGVRQQSSDFHHRNRCVGCCSAQQMLDRKSRLAQVSVAAAPLGGVQLASLKGRPARRPTFHVSRRRRHARSQARPVPVEQVSIAQVGAGSVAQQVAQSEPAARRRTSSTASSSAAVRGAAALLRQAGQTGEAAGALGALRRTTAGDRLRGTARHGRVMQGEAKIARGQEA